MSEMFKYRSVLAIYPSSEDQEWNRAYCASQRILEERSVGIRVVQGQDAHSRDIRTRTSLLRQG